MVAVNGTSYTTTEYEGTVARVNDRGLLFDGRPAWVNISRFAGAITLPAAGQRVRCTLDGSGFIRTIDVLDTPAPEPRQNRGSGAQDAASEAPDRERLIIRQSCLKAAATICTYRPEITAADVISIAAQFEQWVAR